MTQRRPVPQNVSQRDPLLSFGPIQLTIGGIMTVLLSLVFWFIIARITSDVLGFLSGHIKYIPLNFAQILWFWMPLGALYLVFARRDGLSMEEWVARKIEHSLRPDTYLPIDEARDDAGADVHEILWDEGDPFR